MAETRSSTACRAGAATVDITPSRSLDMAGGAFGAASGTVHALQIDALVVEGPQGRVAVLACDLLAVGADVTARLRRAAAGAADCRPEAVTLACTHTHGAPATVALRKWGQPDEAYLARLEGDVADVCARAAAGLEPARFVLADGPCAGVAVNRADPDGPTPDRVDALRVEATDGRPIAVAVHYHCHPVNLHMAGKYTPDYPHFLRARLAETMKMVAPTLFLQGAAGDLVPANFNYGHPDEAAARHTGTAIADAAGEAMKGAEPVEVGRVAGEVHTITLPLAPLPSEEELEVIIADRRARLDALPDTDENHWKRVEQAIAIEWAEEARDAIRAGDVPATTDLRVQTVRLGDLTLLAFPGEVFHGIGRRIQGLGDGPVWLTGPANGCRGYIPTPEAYEAERYEAIHAPRHIGLRRFRSDVGEALVEALREVV